MNLDDFRALLRDKVDRYAVPTFRCLDDANDAHRVGACILEHYQVRSSRHFRTLFALSDFFGAADGRIHERVEVEEDTRAALWTPFGYVLGAAIAAGLVSVDEAAAVVGCLPPCPPVHGVWRWADGERLAVISPASWYDTTLSSDGASPGAAPPRPSPPVPTSTPGVGTGGGERGAAGAAARDEGSDPVPSPPGKGGNKHA